VDTGDRTPQLDRAAVASLWSGVMAVGPAALACGIVARRRIRRSNGALTGGGLATAGIVFGLVYTLLLIAGAIAYFA
jgi:hypothetical protein